MHSSRMGQSWIAMTSSTIAAIISHQEYFVWGGKGGKVPRDTFDLLAEVFIQSKSSKEDVIDTKNCGPVKW